LSLIKITKLLDKRSCLNLLQKFKKSKTNPKAIKKTDKLVSFIKLFSLISVKTSKEVKEISKFFKKISQLIKKKGTKKSYMQALSTSSNTKEILKIKETFLKLQAKKSKKIINDNGKSKPKLNMLIKSLFRKQFIVPMSNENKSKFMKSSSIQITNLNRALKISNLKL